MAWQHEQAGVTYESQTCAWTTSLDLLLLRSSGRAGLRYVVQTGAWFGEHYWSIALLVIRVSQVSSVAAALRVAPGQPSISSLLQYMYTESRSVCSNNETAQLHGHVLQTVI